MKEAFWIIDQLICQGVSQFCIAPGSRNSPLVIAAAEHPLAKTIVHYDERGLGFYALGFGKGAKKAACVITTSGTAVGNLLPSVMEAHHAEIPLIVLHGDRPLELRDAGANQTTDHVKIFTQFVRWQIDIPPNLPENALRSLAAQAVFSTLSNPPGPVQINCQFREPLYVAKENLKKGSPVSFTFPKQIAPPTKVSETLGVILLGDCVDPRPVLNLAKRLKWPVFADILSNARLYPSYEQIRHFDWMLKQQNLPKPQFILHFGKRLTSKKILDWPPTMHVSPSPFLQDPARALQARVQCEFASFCETFEAPTDPSWLEMWKEKDEEIKVCIEEAFQAPFSFTEAHAMRNLKNWITKSHAVFLGASMPIRDGDHFLFPDQCLGFFANRGLSGIDGTIATAAGLSDGLNAPVIAIIGDQASLHDLNSLPLLKKTSHPVTLILSNNFGSGIFSHLPISKWPHFETFMAASHEYQFQEAARMFDIPYLPFEAASFQKSAIIEIFTDRKENHRFSLDLLSSLSKKAILH